MSVTPCQLLDDYIAHDLSADERTRFEAHLTGCRACQRVILEETELGILLTTAVETLERVPHDLILRTAHRLRRVRHRRIAGGLAALAAAVVVLVFVSRPLFRSDIEPPAPMNQELPPPRLADVGPPKVEVRVRFPRAAGVIALPVASESPHVTLVQVYSVSRGASVARMEKSGLQLNQGAKYEHD
jgi:Putative zinc-finger